MKKVGLVLGGGSAKGFAHLGVLEVLEKNKIPIYCIAGTSIGSVVGSLYASGLSVRELKGIAKKTKWEKLVDFTLPDRGILSGKKIERFLRVLLRNKRFEDLKIPTAVVAVDVYKGEKIVFKRGDVASAVRASISIPSLFVPFEYNKRILVDGGLVDPLPIDVVRDIGADVVIAVDLSTKIKDVAIKSKTREHSSFLKRMEKQAVKKEIDEINKYIIAHQASLPWIIRFILNKPKKIINYFTKNKLKEPELLRIVSNSLNIMVNELSRRSAESADLVIKPNLEGVSIFDFDKVAITMKRGRMATEDSIGKIKKLVK